MATAGGSARAEYERRRAKDRAQIRGNLWQRVAVVAATPLLVFAAVRLGGPWALHSFTDSVARQTAPGGASAVSSPTPVDVGLWTSAGVLVAAGATVTVGKQLFGRRRSTEAWRKGAEGEEQTARLLHRLPRSYTVLHDLPMPRARGNIDHVVIGPTGAFTVETKRYASGVRIRGGRVSAGGRARDGIVAQAQRQAHAMSGRLGRPVTPIVVVHGGVDVGWLGSGVVDGVRFCSPGRVCKVITTGPTRLSNDEVERVRAQLTLEPDVSPGPLTPPTSSAIAPTKAPASGRGSGDEGCTCGGTWVRRQRRSDGAAFLGCSAFPVCRQTRPIG